ALAAVEAFSGAAGSLSLMPAEANGETASVQGAGSHDGRLDDDLVRTAFAMMSSPGRLEIVRRSPLVVVDAAHNPAGMAATAAALTESFGPAEAVAVLAISADKDVAGVLDALEPVAAGVVVTTNSSPRSMPAIELAELARTAFGPDRVHVAERLDDAIEVAVGLADEAASQIGGPLAGLVASGDAESLASAGAMVLITGSVATAGDARALLSYGGGGAATG
ncbi:MAG TPA: cyanophycin synthetase, partial [Streptosporangiaceae bacterium]|nr:cyanophycin synthetase [Streptosporangiaceae bacterium]